MPHDDQHDDHQELLRRVAALTERVHRLEHHAGLAQVPANRPLPAPSELTPPPPVSPKAGSQDALESRIGGHWLNRVGIVAVLIGASYFLKYAFDNQWVGPAGRVLVGLLGGLAAIIWSGHVRRTGYALFSYSLQALGVGLLYLSLWASSQLYGLVSTALAFIAMTAVTGSTVALALWQNAQVVASFALLGAFLTPVVLSTGENRAVSLFTYIAILDIGALVLVRYRPWTRILIGSYAGTLILYFAWHARFYTVDQVAIAAIAASIFFVVFALVPFLVQFSRDSAGLLTLVLANAAAYFLQIYDLFSHAENRRLAAVAASGLAGVYFLIARRVPDGFESAVRNVHWTVGIALLTVAIPIGLDQHWITIGWFVEAGALVSVSRRAQNEFLKYFGAAALVLGVLRLILIDNFTVARLVFNDRMMTFVVAVAVLAFVARAVATAGKDDERLALPVLIVSINVLALFALNQEITDAWRRQTDLANSASYRTLNIVRDFAYSALWMSYGAGLMFAGFWKGSRFLRWQALILIAVTVGKVFLYDTSSLDRGYRILSLIALGVILLATSFLYQRNWFKLGERRERQ